MLALDIRTLLVVTALTSTIASGALFALWRAQVKQNGSGYWAAGMFCVALGSIFISGRYKLPDFISVVLANTLFVVGFVLFLRGICIFTERPSKMLVNYSLTPIAMALFYYFYYISPDINIRIAVLSTAFGITCFTIVTTLLKEKNAPWRTAGYAVAIVFGMFGLFHSLRGAIALALPFNTSLMQDSISTSIVFLVGIFMLAGITITLILLVYTSLESKFKIVSLAVDQSASSIMITDNKGIIEYVNSAFSKNTGYLESEITGKKPKLLGAENTLSKVNKDIWKTIKTGNTWRGEFQNRRKNGQVYWELTTITPVKQNNGQVSHYVAVQEDITALKEAEARILHLAYHDVLTGLPSRRLSMDRLSSALSVAKRNKTKVAMMFVDLDGFKAINDTFGHDAGDQVLKETASRLQAVVREVDTVGRVGGDEFWVILTNVDDQKIISNIADKIVKSVSTPYQFNDALAKVTASIGISVYPDHTLDAEELVKQADHTMYKIKQHGKNDFEFVKQLEPAS